MSAYRPSDINDATLNYYYTAQPTADGTYYRIKQPREGFPDGFYASERDHAQHQTTGTSSAQQSTTSRVFGPSDINDAALNYYYAAQPTAHGTYYRIKQPREGFPDGFYASERDPARHQPSGSPSAQHIITISIAVFVGDPVDYQKYRHTALCIRTPGEHPWMMHIVGPNRAYAFQLRNNYDPTSSGKFAKEVQVGRVKKSITKAELTSLIRQTKIDNSSGEFNCHVWVGDALERLVDANCLTKEERLSGIEGMIDATMEARDEP